MIGTREVVSGTMGNVGVKLLVSGPGMVNAAQAVTAVIEHEKPDLIIQTGCAGVFRRSGMTIGDVGIATAEIDIHTGLESSSGIDVPEELPFALIQTHETIKNRYPVDKKLADTAFQILQSDTASSSFKVQKGPFITVSTITTTNQRADVLWKKFRPCMEQMEGAAVAHAAIIYHIPFVEIRSASNYVGNRNRNSWNPDLAFKNACHCVYKFIHAFEYDKLNI